MLTNVIVTGFGERFNLVRDSKMFIKDEQSGRWQVKSGVFR